MPPRACRLAVREPVIWNSDYMPKVSPCYALVYALAALLIAGCTTNPRTSLVSSWVDPKVQGTKFRKVLILSLASDEFAQQYFQEDMAAALRKRGVNAVASERFFTNSTPPEQARFKRAVEASDADAVLLARVIGVDEKTVYTAGMLVGPLGTPEATAVGIYGAYAQAFAPTRYVRPNDYTVATVLVEVLLYETKSKRAVWSAQTSIANARSGDLAPGVAQFVSVVVGAMDRDNLF